MHMQDAGGIIKCGALLYLATTFIEDSLDPRKHAAQESVLKSYQRLRQAGGLQAFLFTKNHEWAKKAQLHGVFVVSDIDVNTNGTPKVEIRAYIELLHHVKRVPLCSSSVPGN
jgi:hypothetical protein